MEKETRINNDIIEIKSDVFIWKYIIKNNIQTKEISYDLYKDFLECFKYIFSLNDYGESIFIKEVINNFKILNDEYVIIACAKDKKILFVTNYRNIYNFDINEQNGNVRCEKLVFYVNNKKLSISEINHANQVTRFLTSSVEVILTG